MRKKNARLNPKVSYNTFMTCKNQRKCYPKKVVSYLIQVHFWLSITASLCACSVFKPRLVSNLQGWCVCYCLINNANASIYFNLHEGIVSACEGGIPALPGNFRHERDACRAIFEFHPTNAVLPFIEMYYIFKSVILFETLYW